MDTWTKEKQLQMTTAEYVGASTLFILQQLDHNLTNCQEYCLNWRIKQKIQKLTANSGNVLYYIYAIWMQNLTMIKSLK